MFPFIFEWAWDASHMVFMGGLWYALIIICAGVGYVMVKSAIDTAKGEGAEDDQHGH